MEKENKKDENVWISQFRVYSVKEISTKYYPLLQPNSATRSLTRVIWGDSELLRKLQSCGYKKGIRNLTPAMVKHIASYLGTPSEFRSILE